MCFQLNPNRATKRRHPENITDIQQPFDPALFNFTKVSDKEIIMEISSEDGKLDPISFVRK